MAGGYPSRHAGGTRSRASAVVPSRPREGRAPARPQSLSARIFPHIGRGFGIIVSTMLKQGFRDFIFATNTDGSGNAASYVRAFDMRGKGLAEIANQWKDGEE